MVTSTHKTTVKTLGISGAVELRGGHPVTVTLDKDGGLYTAQIVYSTSDQPNVRDSSQWTGLAELDTLVAENIAIPADATAVAVLTSAISSAAPEPIRGLFLTVIRTGTTGMHSRRASNKNNRGASFVPGAGAHAQAGTSFPAEGAGFSIGETIFPEDPANADEISLVFWVKLLALPTVEQYLFSDGNLETEGTTVYWDPTNGLTVKSWDAGVLNMHFDSGTVFPALNVWTAVLLNFDMSAGEVMNFQPLGGVPTAVENAIVDLGGGSDRFTIPTWFFGCKDATGASPLRDQEISEFWMLQNLIGSQFFNKDTSREGWVHASQGSPQPLAGPAGFVDLTEALGATAGPPELYAPNGNPSSVAYHTTATSEWAPVTVGGLGSTTPVDGPGFGVV